MFTINCRGRLHTFHQPVVMGIMNITPDSFFEGSRSNSVNAALEKAGQMLGEGAAILDIGGQSTRPGSTKLNAEEEISRVVPVIEAIRKNYPQSIISIDTFYAAVAKAAANAGADMVNDISGGLLDADMLPTVASLNMPFVCMHMKGTPQTMTTLSQYSNIVEDLTSYFLERIEACRKAGIKDIILDPGFGFAKKPAQSFTLLKRLSALQVFGLPLLAGISRKSLIWKTLNITADESLNGTTVLNTICLQQGAQILRVHDVLQAAQAIQLHEAIKNAADH